MACFSDYPVRVGSMAIVAAASGSVAGYFLCSMLHNVRHDNVAITCTLVAYAGLTIAVAAVLTWLFFPTQPTLPKFNAQQRGKVVDYLSYTFGKAHPATGSYEALRTKAVAKKIIQAVETSGASGMRRTTERSGLDDLELPIEPAVPLTEEEYQEKLKHIPFGEPPGIKRDKLTIRVQGRADGFYIVCDEDPSLVEACSADHAYENPNLALGHFMFQVSTILNLPEGIKLDIRLENDGEKV